MADVRTTGTGLLTREYRLLRERARSGWSWIHQIYQEFQNEHASITAAAIALFGLLSLFPLVLLAIAGASYALGSAEEAIRQIEMVMGRVLVADAARAFTSIIEGVLDTRGAAGIIGLLGFLWAASRVFNIMIETFNMAWDADESRGFIKRNLLAIGLVLLVFVFGIISFLTPLAAGLLARYSDRVTRWLGVPINVSGTWPILVDIGAYAATLAMFFILYKVVPSRRVHWHSALAGAVVAAVLWELAKYLFRLYVVNFASYNEVYGALAGVIVLILWLYYSAVILMLGAITSSVHSARVFGDRPDHPRRRGYDERGEQEA
ncbi:MAG: YihY/virulence factor BrkB family protein [Armatimonadetes bacterium]|nr:YihY/virulence factor BrkB family protein [Armatimonadota bacterium]